MGNFIDDEDPPDIKEQKEIELEHLIANGLDPNCKINSDEDTLWMYALKTKKLDLLDHLNECNINSLITSLNSAQKENLSKYLANFIDNEDPPDIKEQKEIELEHLIANGLDPNCKINSDEDTLWMYAVKTKNLDLLDHLNECNINSLITSLNSAQKENLSKYLANFIDDEDPPGLKKQKEIKLKYLIEYGLDPNCKINSQGDTFLMYAVKNANENLYSFLMSYGADPEQRNIQGENSYSYLPENQDLRNEFNKITNKYIKKKLVHTVTYKYRDREGYGWPFEKAISQMNEELTNYIQNPHLISDQTQHFQLIQNILDPTKNSLPKIFPILIRSPKGHGIYITLYEDKLIITNKGYGDNYGTSNSYPGSFILELNQDTKDNIQQLQTFLLKHQKNSITREEFVTKIRSHCKQDDATWEKLSETNYIPSKPQKPGTCTFTNLKSTIFAILCIKHGWSIDGEAATKSTAIKLAKQPYKEFTNHIRTRNLNIVIEKINSPSTQPAQKSVYIESLAYFLLSHNDLSKSQEIVWIKKIFSSLKQPEIGKVIEYFINISQQKCNLVVNENLISILQKFDVNSIDSEIILQLNQNLQSIRSSIKNKSEIILNALNSRNFPKSKLLLTSLEKNSISLDSIPNPQDYWNSAQSFKNQKERSQILKLLLDNKLAIMPEDEQNKFILNALNKDGFSTCELLLTALKNTKDALKNIKETIDYWHAALNFGTHKKNSKIVQLLLDNNLGFTEELETQEKFILSELNQNNFETSKLLLTSLKNNSASLDSIPNPQDYWNAALEFENPTERSEILQLLLDNKLVLRKEEKSKIVQLLLDNNLVFTEELEKKGKFILSELNENNFETSKLLLTSLEKNSISLDSIPNPQDYWKATLGFKNQTERSQILELLFNNKLVLKTEHEQEYKFILNELYNKNFSTCKLLLNALKNAKHSLENIKNSQSYWHAAAQLEDPNERSQILKLLLENGLEVIKNPSITDNDNYDYLLQFLEQEAFDSCILLLNHPSKSPFSLKKSINAKHYWLAACTIENATTKKDLIKLLLEKGLDPNIQIDDNGSTPLHYAALDNDLEICELLLKHQANPNILNNDSYTPLHYAAIENELEICKLLLEHQANPNMLNKKNNTAYDLTSMQNIKDLIKPTTIPQMESDIPKPETTKIEKTPTNPLAISLNPEQLILNELNNGNLSACKLLLTSLKNNSASLANIPNPQDYWNAALKFENQTERSEILQLLLDNKLVLIEDNGSKIILKALIEQDFSKCELLLTLLINNHITLENIESAKDYWVAALNFQDKDHQLTIIELLLKNNLNTQIPITKSGNNIFMFAVKDANIDLCKLLLKYQADPLNTVEINGIMDSPLLYALRNKSYETSILLITHIKNSDPTILTLEEYLGYINEFPEKQKNTIIQLLQNQANPKMEIDYSSDSSLNEEKSPGQIETHESQEKSDELKNPKLTEKISKRKKIFQRILDRFRDKNRISTISPSTIYQVTEENSSSGQLTTHTSTTKISKLDRLRRLFNLRKNKEPSPVISAPIAAFSSIGEQEPLKRTNKKPNKRLK